MTEQVPNELSQVTQDIYAAREAFVEAARNYDAALDRYMKAWEQHRAKLSTSEMPYVVALGKTAMYGGQIAGAQEHKEMLQPILDYFNQEGSKG